MSVEPDYCKAPDENGQRRDHHWWLAKLYFIQGYMASQKALRGQFNKLIAEGVKALSKNED